MSEAQPGDTLRAFLQDQLGYPWWLTFADLTSGQYGILSSPAWAAASEPALGGGDPDLDTDFRVKVVTGTTTGVVTMLGRVRALLWANRQPTRIPMPGWFLETRYMRSEFVDVDESTTRPGTNLHPAFGVDTYHLTAQPL